MKREGRQHGSVRTLPQPWNTRPESRLVNRLDSPPTAGLFTRVSPKPTNHSKFTGPWGGSHSQPASKSKDKAKGTQKLRSCDVASNHRLVTWRVVDGKPGLKFAGFSASGILDHLASDCCIDGDDDCVDEVYEDSCDLDLCDSVESEIASAAVEINVDDENEDMGFYDVAHVWDRADVDEDEDWCLVAAL